MCRIGLWNVVSRSAIIALTISLGHVLCAAQWEYVSSSQESGFDHPLYCTIALSTEKPEIDEEVVYRGATQRYALLRYGTPNSLRVAIVVDEVSRSDFDLYVDVDRDRTITSDEKIDGKGRLRQLLLKAEVARSESDVEVFPRLVRFRRGISSRSISFATLGYIQGRVSLAGRSLRARRVDANGDGLFSSSRDRVWLDLDDNALWEPFVEQFPYLPILKIAGNRYAVRGDVIGKRLELHEITGTGRVRLRMKLADPNAMIDSIEVMLVGDDGSAITLQGKDAITVPTGQYTVNTVHVMVKEETDGTVWDFVFSDNGDQFGQRAYKLDPGEQVDIDPIGKLRFELEVTDGQRPAEPGGQLNFRPRLYTEDGLLINSSNCDDGGLTRAGHRSSARIALQHESGLVLAATSSGFA